MDNLAGLLSKSVPESQFSQLAGAPVIGRRFSPTPFPSTLLPQHATRYNTEVSIPAPGVVTSLLAEANNGDQRAMESLLAIIYPELRRIAGALMRKERPGHTLQSTALVHEAFMRLFDGVPIPWADSREFLVAAAREMRRTLADHGRRNRRQKRSHHLATELPPELPFDPKDPLDVITVDQALTVLNQISEQVVRVVELKFYLGLTIEEISSVLGVPVTTVKGEWKYARAWLSHYLSGAARH
jgi:RNA polymerase sigma-70 factor (ECF subfamily)